MTRFQAYPAQLLFLYEVQSLICGELSLEDETVAYLMVGLRTVGT